MGINISGDKKSKIGADGHHPTVGEVGEFEDVEDDAKPDRLQGIDPAEGDSIKDLLEQDVQFHGSSPH